MIYGLHYNYCEAVIFGLVAFIILLITDYAGITSYLFYELKVYFIKFSDWVSPVKKTKSGAFGFIVIVPLKIVS